MHEGSANEAFRDRHPAAHWDELWAIELAEITRRVRNQDAAGSERGLLRHLHTLQRQYASRTPHDLPREKLPGHADGIEGRYDRILAHVRYMVEPSVADSRALKRRLRQNLDLNVYYRSVHRWQREITSEMEASIRFWQWVDAHGHLPHGPFHWRMSPLASRPIAHPWTCVRSETLEALGRLENELAAAV